jgi:hypothetical protein
MFIRILTRLMHAVYDSPELFYKSLKTHGGIRLDTQSMIIIKPCYYKNTYWFKIYFCNINLALAFFAYTCHVFASFFKRFTYTLSTNFVRLYGSTKKLIKVI